ncbi:MAG: hypothetical protein C4321_09705 [Chloroflexota bacterium]
MSATLVATAVKAALVALVYRVLFPRASWPTLACFGLLGMAMVGGLVLSTVLTVPDSAFASAVFAVPGAGRRVWFPGRTARSPLADPADPRGPRRSARRTARLRARSHDRNR